MFDQISPTVIPKSSVMRFDNSTEISHSVAAGTSPVFDHSTVGNDISSATQGSSVARVAGKNRAPTKQCANAFDTGKPARTIASAATRRTVQDMITPQWLRLMVSAGRYRPQRRKPV